MQQSGDSQEDEERPYQVSPLVLSTTINDSKDLENGRSQTSLPAWPLNEGSLVKSRYDQPVGGASSSERLQRRQELCARARDETIRIMSYRQIQREAVREEMIRNKTLDETENVQATYERNNRWGAKLKKSPFTEDLVAQLEQAQRLAEEREMEEKREARERYVRHRDARNLIFKRAVADGDRLEMLRREKRVLLENERRLAAMCDVEKTNAKALRIHEERQQKEIERQQRLLQKKISAVMGGKR